MAKPPPFLDPDPYSRAPTRRDKPPIPGAGELARMIREDGYDLNELGALYQRNPKSLIRRLNSAGYSTHTGEPMSRPEQDDVPHGLDKPFEYPAWMDDANCAGTDPEAFFPHKGGSTKEAKKVCSRCTVQAECLDYATDNVERFGIFGGLSERERRRIKKILTPPAAPREMHQPGRQALIRQWAVGRGIEVNPVGSLPRHVIDLYDAAHPDEEPATHNQQESA